jgi:hypothetical protein
VTYFPQIPSFSQSPLGATPPRNPREAADAIMAYLEREAASAAIPRTPFAPFLAETYEPSEISGERDYAPAAPSDVPYAFDPAEAEEDEETERLLPYPDAQTDDERIENVMWLLENNPSEVPTAGEESDASVGFGLGSLFGLIGSAEAAPKGKLRPPFQFDFSKVKIARDRLTRIIDAYRRQMHNYERNELRLLEPDNPLLATAHPEDYLPSAQDKERLNRELVAARKRALDSGASVAKRVGGESESAIGGRAAHLVNAYGKLGRRSRTNVRIGRYVADRLDQESQRRALLREMKSDRPVTVRRGERQGQQSANEHEKQTGMITDYRVDTYNLPDFIKWLLSQLK